MKNLINLWFIKLQYFCDLPIQINYSSRKLIYCFGRPVILYGLRTNCCLIKQMPSILYSARKIKFVVGIRVTKADTNHQLG